MHLKELQLINFKNYESATMHFDESVVVFTGKNGSGKTNLLDAIHYLCACKSFINPIDTQNILHEAPFFVVQGSFENNDKTEAIYCGLKRGQKKIFKKNGKDYERLAEHIGQFPQVIISPSDATIILEGSEERRRWMDSVIAQYNRNYLDKLIQYNRIVAQRNAGLKQGNLTDELLDILDMQLPDKGNYIHAQRIAFIEQIQPLFHHYYEWISGNAEAVKLEYDSQLNNQKFEDALLQARQKDRMMQYSTLGVHKDELQMKMNGFPLKKYASQGQQKSFMIALKLAQFDILAKEKGLKPLLLLDDIFDKLDEQRTTALMKLVSQQHFGQIFITDAHVERVAEILRGINCSFAHFLVEQGSITRNEA